MNCTLRVFWPCVLAISILDNLNATNLSKVNFDPIYLKEKIPQKAWLAAKSEQVEQKQNQHYLTQLAAFKGTDIPVGSPTRLSLSQTGIIFGRKPSHSEVLLLDSDKIKYIERGLSFKNILFWQGPFVSLNPFIITPDSFANKLKTVAKSKGKSAKIDCNILRMLANQNDIGKAVSWFYGLMVANAVTTKDKYASKETGSIPPMTKQLENIRGTDEPLGHGTFIISKEEFDEYVESLQRLSFYKRHLKISKNVCGDSIVTLDLQKTTPALFANELKNVIQSLKHPNVSNEDQGDILILDKLPKAYRKSNIPEIIINQFYGVIIANTAAICETVD